MKKFFYLIFIVGVLMFCASCSNAEDSSVVGKTMVMVDLKSDLLFKGEASDKNISRAVDESAYKDVNNYTVTLFKASNGENIHSALYSEWNLRYEVEPGVDYRIDAEYGNPDFKASYDELYMFGSTTFNLSEGESKTISFQCKPKAVKVKMFLSDDFEQYFKECSISIKTKYLEEPFIMTLADKDKELYLFEDSDDQIELDFKLVDKNDKTANQSKVVNVSPQTFLKINMSPDVTEVEGGKFGIDINLDASVTDEDVNITIPNSQFK